MVGLGVFTACSLLGGVAQTGSWLIAARAAQGVGGAVMATVAATIATNHLGDTHRVATALSDGYRAAFAIA